MGPEETFRAEGIIVLKLKSAFICSMPGRPGPVPPVPVPRWMASVVHEEIALNYP